MIWVMYNVLFAIGYVMVLPYFLWRMIRRGGYARDFLQRVGWYSAEARRRLASPGRVWIQAVSVGELYVALGFMDRLRARMPGIRFVLSTTTSTGYAIARNSLTPDDALIYFPADFPWIVRRVLALIRPAAIVLVENELWPNLIRIADAQGIPVALINGRISPRSFRGYQRIRFFMRRILPLLNPLCVQTAEDAQRLLTLGAREGTVHVVGTAKYDLVRRDPAAAQKAREALRAAGISDDAIVLMGGSTWPGEEEALADIYLELKSAFPALALVIVPRHVERVPEIEAMLSKKNLAWVRRSQLPDQNIAARAGNILLVDTTGELAAFYSCASVAFVGKSLTATGGQNIIEPAVWGKAIVVGPHVENFLSVVEDFRQAQALIQVQDANELKNVVRRLLQNPAEREQLGERAAAVVQEKGGGLERTLDYLAPILSRAGVQ